MLCSCSARSAHMRWLVLQLSKPSQTIQYHACDVRRRPRHPAARAPVSLTRPTRQTNVNFITIVRLCIHGWISSWLRLAMNIRPCYKLNMDHINHIRLFGATWHGTRSASFRMLLQLSSGTTFSVAAKQQLALFASRMRSGFKFRNHGKGAH